MKKLLLPLFSLLLLIFSCNRASIVEQEPITPPERSSYKIPLDSLTRQAVSLGAIFGSPATKSRVVRVKNAVEIGSLLGERSVSRSGADDADAPRAYVINFDGGRVLRFWPMMRVCQPIFSPTARVEISTRPPTTRVFCSFWRKQSTIWPTHRYALSKLYTFL